MKENRLRRFLVSWAAVAIAITAYAILRRTDINWVSVGISLVLYALLYGLYELLAGVVFSESTDMKRRR